MGMEKAAPKVDPPPFPVALGYLWAAFVRLDTSRGASGFGVERIKATEMEAWSRLTQNPLDPWEVRALWALDDLRVKVLNDSGGST